MKIICSAILILFVYFPITHAQLYKKEIFLNKKENIVFYKNFPLLHFVLQNEDVEKKIIRYSSLSSLYKTQKNNFEIETNAENKAFVAMMFTEQQIQKSSEEVSKKMLQNVSKDDYKKISRMLQYQFDSSFTIEEKIRKEWIMEFSNINQIIEIYGNGKVKRYADIDSISPQISLNKKFFYQRIVEQLSIEIRDSTNSSFIFTPIKTALLLLELNGRMHAADYEPMEKTVNKNTVLGINKIRWSHFPYSHILVPGAGPEVISDSINPLNILRCRLAAIQYQKGLAPLIVVSGGRVHPYHTNYSEAEEMKKYLINECSIPDYAIIMEPHARHTTTNIRNTVRLLYKYNVPIDKKGLITSTNDQMDFVRKTSFRDRCEKEMGVVPFLLGKDISTTSTEYQPLLNALFVNSIDPLDP